MITASQIAPLRQETLDHEDTERLKARLSRIRCERQPLSLSAGEFDDILQWKLGQQIGRQRARRGSNTEEVIRGVTGLALPITHPDEEYLLELQIGILCTLRGVGVPVASAVLALTFPERYAIVDFRGWRQVFGTNQSVFSISDYKRYMREIRRLARELGWPVQEVDHAIWEYDRQNGSPVLPGVA